MTWRRRHFVKGAVHAITDFEFVFEGLEVNVARAILDRLIENKIDKPNDRGCVRLRFNRSLAVAFAELQELASFAELFENFLRTRRIGSVVLLDQILDLTGRRDDYMDVCVEREAEIICSVCIERGS